MRFICMASDEKAEILGIIPARGGSKSIPRKSIKLFLGKPLIAWAISGLKENEKYVPDFVVLFEPTSAAKRPYHVREIVEKLVATGADSVISIAEVPGVLNPMWQVAMDANDRLSIFTGGPLKNFIPQRQSLPKTYYRNSSIYAFRPSLLFSPEPNIYGDDSRGCIVDKKFAFDIDEPSDWEAAEEKFKKILEEEKP